MFETVLNVGNVNKNIVIGEMKGDVDGLNF